MQTRWRRIWRTSTHASRVVLLSAVVALVVVLLATGTAYAQGFSDVGPDDWFAAPVDELSSAGIIQGFPDGSFRPYETVTRAQFAAMMDRALSVPDAEGAPFADVVPSDWYYPAVSRLYAVGLVRGTGQGLFAPQAGIAREQAASMVIRALAYRLAQQSSDEQVSGEEGGAGEEQNKGGLVSLDLGPDEVQAWLATLRDRWFIAQAHRDNVAQCLRLAVMTGYPDERFYPMLTLTRAQAAGIVHRALYSPVQAREEIPPAVAADAGYPTQKMGSQGILVAFLENRLVQLGYALIQVDDYYGESTKDAVMAFQKVEGLQRDGDAGPQVWGHLPFAERPRPRYSASGKRVEIDLTRQVLFLIEDDQVVKVLNCSSGAEGWRTPPGTFTVFRKDVDWQKSPLGYLYYPAYFNGGIAIHGSWDVPGWPASHGCIRIPVWSAIDLWNELHYGIRVDVYY